MGRSLKGRKEKMKKLLLSLIVIVAVVAAAIIAINAREAKGTVLANPPPPSEPIVVPDGYPYSVRLPGQPSVEIRYNYAFSQSREEFAVKYIVHGGPLDKKTYVLTYVFPGDVGFPMYGTILEASPEGTISIGYQGVIRGATLSSAPPDASVKVIIV